MFITNLKEKNKEMNRKQAGALRKIKNINKQFEEENDVSVIIKELSISEDGSSISAAMAFHLNYSPVNESIDVLLSDWGISVKCSIDDYCEVIEDEYYDMMQSLYDLDGDADECADDDDEWEYDICDDWEIAGYNSYEEYAEHIYKY